MRFPTVNKPYLSWMLAGLVVLGGVPLGLPAEEHLVTGKAPDTRPHPVISSEFESLTRQLMQRSARARHDLSESMKSIRDIPAFVVSEHGKKIEAYIELEEWSESVRRQILDLGAELIAESPALSTMQVWLPFDRIEKIASVPGLRQIRRPSYGIPTAGAVDTEGNSLLGAPAIRAIKGFTGANVRVGVISRGLYGSGFSFTNPMQGANQDLRVQTGDLPPHPNSTSENPVTSGFLGNVAISPQTHQLHNVGSGVIEGGALLEIIHDLAPDARLFYADGSTTVRHRSAQRFLLNNNVDIIIDNMAFFDVGRFDGTSPVSRRATEIALNEDVLYFTSVGNYLPPPDDLDTFSDAASPRFPLFINGFFSPDPSDTTQKVHNWSWAREATLRDEGLVIFPAPSGEFDDNVIDVVLIWDDIWDNDNPRAKDDLDLFLVDSETLSLNLTLASSTNIQNGESGVPFERITFFGNTDAALLIKRKNNKNNTRTFFTLIILSGRVDQSDVQFLTHGVPLSNGDALPPAISVGAVDTALSIQRVSEFTVPGLSPGPGLINRGRYLKWYVQQIAPAVVSYGNVSTLSSFGRIQGSSAAAAHMAGLSALLHQGFPFVSSSDFYAIYRNTSENPRTGFSNAVELEPSLKTQFGNAPRYFKTQGIETFENLAADAAAGVLKRNSYLPLTGDASLEWLPGGAPEDFNVPDFESSNMGLRLSPNGQDDVFGFWESPMFELTREDGGKTTELRSDRVYVVTARIGSDETNPTRVPDFRLRVNSGLHDEGATLVISSRNEGVANAPTTIAGDEYKLYFQPSNEAVAAQGLRFSMDLIHFNESDNSNASLFLHSVKLEEFTKP